MLSNNVSPLYMEYKSVGNKHNFYITILNLKNIQVY